MMGMKLLGAILLAFTGGYGAWLLNRRAERTVDRLDAWIALLRLTKNQIDCFSLPVPDILARCEPSLLARIGWDGEEHPKDFQGLCEAVRGSLTTEEGERIAEGFCDEIGKGYRAEQIRTCDYSIGLFCAERDRLLAELPRRRQRNTTLCMALSLGAAMVLF